MHRLGTIISIWIASILSASGCGKETGLQETVLYDGPVNECRVDGDCPSAAKCDSQRCTISGVANGREYFVKVGPEKGAPSQVFKVTLDEEGNAKEPLVIKKQITSKMIVRKSSPDEEDLNGGETIDARIVFTETGMVIPGRSARIAVYRQSRGFEGFDFSLLPGNYRIAVFPEGNRALNLPVHYVDDAEVMDSGEILDSNGSDLRTLSIPLSQTEVTGVVRRGSRPVNGVTVSALHPDSGRVISTTSVTGCPNGSAGDFCGEFSIWLASGTGAFSLHISVPEEGQYPVSIIEGFEVPQAGETIDLSDDARLSLEPLGLPVRYMAQVEKPVVLPSGEQVMDPAPGCLLLFESQDVGSGRVVYGAETNEGGFIEESNGIIGVDLYPASYDIVVIPAEASPDSQIDYAIIGDSDPVQISGAVEISGQLFSLPARPRVEGRIVVGVDEVPGTSVIAEPLPASFPYARSSTTASDSSGEFATWIDFGRYRLTAEAPIASGYAWGVTTLNVSADSQAMIELPLPFTARAELISDDVDLKGAVVEWYEVTAGRGYAVARVTADETGQITALLPPE